MNYTDISQRSGSNKIPLPAVLGSEGAGTVERLGDSAGNFKPGDRVAYAMVRGSYAEYAAVPAKMLVKIPAGIDFRTAAAAMLQGMTAHYLSHSTVPLKGGPHGVGPRGRRRHWPTAGANGRDAGRSRDRHCRNRSQGGTGTRGRRKRRDFFTVSRIGWRT